MRVLFHPGVSAALLAALLFGAGTPLSKLLLAQTSPWMLAGLLYAGSGVGLSVARWLGRAPSIVLVAADRAWLFGAVLSGGVVAPLLLMYGLASTPASTAALLLNAEGVFTAVLAWCVFRENVDRRVALGMVAIVAGALVLSVPFGARIDLPSSAPVLAILGACLGWAIDNNLTRKVAHVDASWVAAVKGLVSGATNLALAFLVGATLPSPFVAMSATAVGIASYGVSLTLFVTALRHLGAARTGAYFSLAPFFGALLSLSLPGERLTPALLVGGTLMAVGVVLHLSEEHDHEHTHALVEHDHEHVHEEGDTHHHHPEDGPTPWGTRHRHPHRHEGVTHTHPHYPDTHHQHTH